MDLFAYRDAGLTKNRHVGAVVNRPFFVQVASQLGIGVARVYRLSKAALWRPINDDNGGRPLLGQS